RHEARDQEVQRDRRPERDHEEPEPAEDEPHDPRLMSAHSPSGTHPFGLRGSRITPQSGTSNAAGFANGFFFVTQPLIDFVLYWYQSTPSVIGMIGTSRTIAASSWLTIECCFAELVVAA